ncbi:hypothetical protein C8R46DRAFT_1031324 [Mycena filopes]|nr:hypothetical protein C8R46DRAFT_1031324 [Mycena filopes]
MYASSSQYPAQTNQLVGENTVAATIINELARGLEQRFGGSGVEVVWNEDDRISGAASVCRAAPLVIRCNGYNDLHLFPNDESRRLIFPSTYRKVVLVDTALGVKGGDVVCAFQLGRRGAPGSAASLDELFSFARK